MWCVLSNIIHQGDGFDGVNSWSFRSYISKANILMRSEYYKWIRRWEQSNWLGWNNEWSWGRNGRHFYWALWYSEFNISSMPQATECGWMSNINFIFGCFQICTWMLCIHPIGVEFRSSCKLVAEKNRIAPSRQRAIPRLELCEAALASRLTQTLIAEWELGIKKTIHTADSTVQGPNSKGI